MCSLLKDDKMSEFNWQSFLQQWSREMLDSAHSNEFPADVATSGWLGFPPATDEEISAVEHQLGISLPPSYRAFLSVSNGWRRTTHFIERLWGTKEINWYRKKNKESTSAFTQGYSAYGSNDQVPDEEYFAYDQWAGDIRPKHFKETLQISAVTEGDTAVCLLNPQVISKDGEWEAWFFAAWLRGAHRYRSFRELMEAQYSEFAGADWKQPAGIIGELPDEYSGSPGSDKRKLKKRKPPEIRPPVEAMIAALGNAEASRKLFPKAAKVSANAWMAGINSERAVARKLVKELGRTRDPRAVDALIAQLTKEEDTWVKEEIIAALGVAKDPRAAEPLLRLLHAEPNLPCHAMHILKKLAPKKLAEPLLELLQEREFFTFASAGMVLGEIGEIRAVPILLEIAKEAEGKEPSQLDRNVAMATQMLAGFGRSGFEALVSLIRTSSSKTVRGMAAGALMYSREPEAVVFLTELLADPDPDIRHTAGIGIFILLKRRQKITDP
jgi:hypothetical protein